MMKRCAAVLVLSLIAQSAVAADRPALGAATPDELVGRLEAATAAADPIALAALMSPRGRAEMSVGLTVAGAMMIAMQGFGMQMAEGMSEAFEGLEDDSTPEAKAAAEAAKAESEKQMAEAQAKIEASSKELEAIFERYGVPNMMDESTEPAGGPEAAVAAFEKIDHLGYLADMFAFMKNAFPEEGEPPAPSVKGPIGTPTIDGDHGSLAVGDETFDLIKLDGRWYVEPPKDAPAEADGG